VKIAIASDHAGFAYKERIKSYLAENRNWTSASLKKTAKPSSSKRLLAKQRNTQK